MLERKRSHVSDDDLLCVFGQTALPLWASVSLSTKSRALSICPPTCSGCWKDQKELMDEGAPCFCFCTDTDPGLQGIFFSLGDLSQLAFTRKASLAFPGHLYEPDGFTSREILTAFSKAESFACLLLGSSGHLAVTLRVFPRPNILTEIELSGTLTIKNSSQEAETMRD